MRVLVVEDDNATSDFIGAALRSASYAVDTAATGEDALHMVGLVDYDLILLDLVLPGLHGLDVLKRIRARKIQTPIIIVSGLVAFDDRAKGLDWGADDYVPKPFSVTELLARVRVCLRREKREPELIFQVGDLEMSRADHLVRRKRKRIELSPKEFSLLEYLMRNKGRVVTREMIFEHVWEWADNPATNIVDVYVSYLRRKIDNGFLPKLIHTVRGVGYCIGVGEPRDNDEWREARV